MIWTFSDGTTVELGGVVTGATYVAQKLRAALNASRRQRIQIWPPPSEPVPLDPNSASMLEAWLRTELDLFTRIDGRKLTLKSPDRIPALPPPPWADEKLDPTLVY